MQSTALLIVEELVAVQKTFQIEAAMIPEPIAMKK
jgi:hypothetical protein